MLSSNLIKIGISQLFVIFSFGLGYLLFQKGEDGKLYLKIEDTDNRVCRYNDNNAQIPLNLTLGDYYGACIDGEYEFQFEWCSGGVWKGTYTLNSEKGDKAGLFSEPRNGRSRWYIFEITKRGNSVFKPGAKSVDTILTQDGVGFRIKANYFPDQFVTENKMSRSI